MGLPFKKNAERKPTAGLMLEDGIYLVKLVSQEDKVDSKKESKRKGYKFHNLKFTFDNGKSLYARVYYENDEADVVPEGYNFLLSLRTVLIEGLPEKKRAKVEEADSNAILNALIKYKIEFYIETRQSTYQGMDYTNINTFTDATYTREEAEELAEKRSLEILSAKPDNEAAETDEEYEDEDEDDDDDL